MINLSGNGSPQKNTISKARKELNSSPLKIRKRRKSSMPLKLVDFINQMKQDSTTKLSYIGDFSNKRNHLRKIPEESENSSIKENENKKGKKQRKHKKAKSDKKKDKNEKNEKIEKNEKKEKKENKDKKNEIENNYYIHYIKNVYENEPHFNKDNIFKSANKNNNETLINFLESNKNIKPIFKRRNSAMNKDIFKSNLMNKHLFLDKIQIDSKLPVSIINKKKSGNIVFHKKKDVKEKEKVKSYLNNNIGNNNKSKNKNKDIKIYKDKNKTKDKNKDSNEENNINTENQKKDIKEKEILENEKKTDNNEHIKIKKINKFKKFLCCFINNSDNSIEND